MKSEILQVRNFAWHLKRQIDIAHSGSAVAFTPVMEILQETVRAFLSKPSPANISEKEAADNGKPGSSAKDKILKNITENTFTDNNELHDAKKVKSQLNVESPNPQIRVLQVAKVMK